MNARLYDCLRKAIQAYAKQKYLQYTEDDIAFFAYYIIKFMEDDNVEQNDENAKKYVKKYGNSINDEMDNSLLTEKMFQNIIIKYLPLAEYKIVQKLKKYSFDINLNVGDIWFELLNKLEIAERTFTGFNKDGKSCSFYTFYSGSILHSVISDALKKRNKNKDKEVELKEFHNEKADEIVNEEFWETFVEQFNVEFDNLSHFEKVKNKERKKLERNIFRLFLLIYYNFPPRGFGFEAQFENLKFPKTQMILN